MKVISIQDAVAMIPNGASLMVGGFMSVGTPERLIDEIVDQDKRNLTVIAISAEIEHVEMRGNDVAWAVGPYSVTVEGINGTYLEMLKREGGIWKWDTVVVARGALQ